MAATISQLLVHGSAELRRAGVPEADQEARWLLQDCLRLSRSELILHSTEEVGPEQEGRFLIWLERRCRREPLAYITGSCQFWSREFQLNGNVLVPRPETELLVEQVLARLPRQAAETSVLDLCCGSGVIAVTLALECPHWKVTGADLSWPALEVARRNMLHHGVRNLSLVCADLLSGFSSAAGFDCIVSNPPYVRTGEIGGLEPEVSAWEPRMALDGGNDGLDLVRRIGEQACRYLHPGGWLLLEIGADQEAGCLQLFASLAAYGDVRVLRDLAGRPRILQARRRDSWTR